MSQPGQAVGFEEASLHTEWLAGTPSLKRVELKDLTQLFALGLLLLVLLLLLHFFFFAKET